MLTPIHRLTTIPLLYDPTTPNREHYSPQTSTTVEQLFTLKQIAGFVMGVFSLFAGLAGAVFTVIKRYQKREQQQKSKGGLGRAVEATISAYSDIKQEISTDIQIRQNILDELRKELNTKTEELTKARQTTLDIEEKFRKREQEQQAFTDARFKTIQEKHDQQISALEEKFKATEEYSDKREQELEIELRNREQTIYNLQLVVTRLESDLVRCQSTKASLGNQPDTNN